MNEGFNYSPREKKKNLMTLTLLSEIEHLQWCILQENGDHLHHCAKSYCSSCNAW